MWDWDQRAGQLHETVRRFHWNTMKIFFAGWMDVERISTDEHRFLALVYEKISKWPHVETIVWNTSEFVSMRTADWREFLKIVPSRAGRKKQSLSCIAIFRLVFTRTSIITLIIARTFFELDDMISITFGNASCIQFAVKYAISQFSFFCSHTILRSCKWILWTSLNGLLVSVNQLWKKQKWARKPDGANLLSPDDS